MNKLRTQAYEDLQSRIGNTPLDKYEGLVPNGNAIWIKGEFANPFGSHYDRVYLELFRQFEESGEIIPGSKVYETSSGSAGVSFAGIGKLLGYECFVALPAGGEKSRETAILEQLPSTEHLIFTPAEDYLNGFKEFILRFRRERKDTTFLNHSMGPRDRKTKQFSNNEVTLSALEGIADEVYGVGIDFSYFAPAVGNGSSVLYFII